MRDISMVKLLPVMSQLGAYLKVGIEHYDKVKEKGPPPSVQTLVTFLEGKMESWDPEISGKRVFDPETKASAVRMIAGVITNLLN